jgi:hypothetical protein
MQPFLSNGNGRLVKYLSQIAGIRDGTLLPLQTVFS